MVTKVKVDYMKESKITSVKKYKRASILVTIFCALILSACQFQIIPSDAPEDWSEQLEEDKRKDTSSESEPDQPVSDEPYAPTFTLTDAGGSWDQEPSLDIFYNDTFNSSTICPGLSGSYTFNITNTSEDDLVYSISLSEENEYDIAMVYKLDIDNIELIDTWVRAKDFKVIDYPLNAGETSTLVLYWYWDENVSDENDTKAALNGMTYSLSITIDAYIPKFDD